MPTSLSVFFCQCLFLSVYTFSSVSTSTFFHCLPSCQCLTVPTLLLVLSPYHQCRPSCQCMLYFQCASAYLHVNTWVQIPGTYLLSVPTFLSVPICTLLTVPTFGSVPTFASFKKKTLEESIFWKREQDKTSGVVYFLFSSLVFILYYLGSVVAVKHFIFFVFNCFVM